MSNPSNDSVSREELHTPTNSKSMKLAPGVTITDLQAYHVGVVFDLFQGKGTMAKLVDAFSKDAVYEDLFADCKNREEIGVSPRQTSTDPPAGQLVNLPLLLSSATTNSHLITSIRPSTTNTGSRKDVAADEIQVKFNHTFVFHAPLPESASSVTMDTTLMIYSAEAEGKVVRLQDRPDEEIPTNGFINMIRKLNAVGVPKVKSLPKDDKEDAESVLKHQR